MNSYLTEVSSIFIDNYLVRSFLPLKSSIIHAEQVFDFWVCIHWVCIILPLSHSSWSWVVLRRFAACSRRRTSGWSANRSKLWWTRWEWWCWSYALSIPQRNTTNTTTTTNVILSPHSHSTQPVPEVTTSMCTTGTEVVVDMMLIQSCGLLISWSDVLWTIVWSVWTLGRNDFLWF